ncbi:MAG: MATE family efflux transporter [Bacteroidia bacterium]|nr:MATE family efflux transporter [Bacteroidia bacterium]
MQYIFRGWRIRYARHIRETLILSFPVVVGQLGTMLMGITDTLMVGRLGYVYVSAGSLANSIFFLISVLGIGITFAITPLVAEAAAKGATEQGAGYLRQGIWVGTGAALIIMVLTLAAAQLLYLMRQPSQDTDLAHGYMQIVSLSAVPLMVFLMSKQFTDGNSQTIPAMFITFVGLGSNVFLNWLLIEGNWGFPALGLDGAAWGTVAARTIMMVLMLGYILWHKSLAVYQVLYGDWRWNLPLMRRILSLGIPAGLQYFFEVGAFSGAAIMVGWMGEGDIASANRAAHQIALQLCALTYMLVMGVSAGATIRVGNAMGMRDLRQVRDAGMTGIVMGGALMLICALALILGRGFLPALFTNDTYVLDLSARLLIIAAFFQLFDGVQAVAAGILRGIRDVRIPTVITFVAYWVVALPVGALLGFTFEMEVAGVWYSFVAGLGLAAIALTWRFHVLTRYQTAWFDVASDPAAVPVIH